MSASKTAEISWALVDSGLDFLQRAVEEMTGDQPDNKYAALHLFSAIEVLIKARLIREHWTLACTKVDGATIAGLKNGDTHTVDPDAGLIRLKTTVGLDIPKEQESKVNVLRKLRNRFAHFAIVTTKGKTDIAIRSALGGGLDFAIWFLETYTRPVAPKAEADLIDACLEELAKVLHELEAYLAERLETIKPKLAKFDVLLDCPNCLQPALTLTDDEPPKCLLCWWEAEGEDSADSYMYNVLNESEYTIIKDGGIWPVRTCPNCEQHAMVIGVDLISNRPGVSLAGEFACVCFSCSFEARAGDVDQCSYCGEWMLATDGLVCFDCAQNLYDAN